MLNNYHNFSQLTEDEKKQFLQDVSIAATNPYAFKMFCSTINFYLDKPDFPKPELPREISLPINDIA
jgi:hypothetical protein